MPNLTELVKEVPGLVRAVCSRQKHPSKFVQFVRYGVVACIALSVDISVLVILREVFDVHYLWAATIGFMCGAVTNYQISEYWVFSNPKITNYKLNFLAVLGIAIIGLALNDLILWALTDGLGLFYLVSKLIATVAIFFWNFIVRRQTLYHN